MKFLDQRGDYDFCWYGEICNFVYRLLLKARSTGCLHSIHEWEGYMSLQNIAGLTAVSPETFLINYDLGQELLNGKTCEVQEFRVNCRK